MPRFELLESRRVLATISWDGGGGNFDWNDAANWNDSTTNLDRLPGASDEVLIGDPLSSFAVTHSSGAHTIKSLDSKQPVVNCTTCHRGEVKPALNLDPRK